MPEALPDFLSPYNHASYYKRAILDGDAELLEQLLSRSDAPQMLRTEIPGSAWHTPLMMALDPAFPEPHAVDLGLVRMLLDVGAPINSIVDYRSNRPSPLYAAIIGGNLDAVNLLIERGADIHHAHPKPPWFEQARRTMLQSAIEGPPLYGNPRTLEAERTRIALRLLELGADPHGAPGEPRPLQIAVRHNNLPVARALIERGVDVNAQEPNDRPTRHEYELSHTALMEAARWEESTVLPLLLERGADLNARDDYGSTALRIAVQYIAPSNARLLLEAGADVNVRGEQGISLMGWALNAGYALENGEPLKDEAALSRRVFELVKLLLEHGADPNSQAMGNMSALSKAIERGELNLVRLLLDAGADVRNSKSYNFACSAVQTLAGRGSPDAGAIAALLGERGLKTSTEELNSSLRSAALKGNLEMVRLLADQGAEIESRNKKGATPLHSAASWGHAEVVRFLLSRGADANARRGENAMTPLMRLAWGGHSDLLRESRLPYEDKPDPDAWVAEQDMAVVRALLEAGAEVNLRDDYQGTALEYAARNSTPQIVQVLVDSGAEVNARRKSKRTILHGVLGSARRQSLLKQDHLVEVIALGYAPNAYNRDEIVTRWKIATEQDEATIQILLAAGAEVNTPDDDGITPLHHAALFATPLAVQMLLDAGADVEARNNKAQTPLQRVLAEGRCARLLAQHNTILSDIEGMPDDLLRAARGETESASIFASAKPEVSIGVKEDVAVLSLLLKAGASQAA